MTKPIIVKSIIDYANFQKELLEMHVRRFEKRLRDDFDSTFSLTINPISYIIDNEKDLLKFAQHPSIATELYNGPFQNISNFIWYRNELCYECINKNNLKANIFIVLLFSNWLSNKQVFKFSNELLKSLLNDIDTNIIDNFDVDILNYLPYNAFLIDFESNEEIIAPTPDTDPRCTLAQIGVFKLDNGSFRIITLFYFNNDLSNPTWHDIVIDKTQTKLKFGLPRAEKDPDGFLPYNCFIIMQILLYLSSSKPDCVKSELSKQIYRGPTKFVKNKPREICTWDVGFRYAESVKKISESKGRSTNNGSAKRPHYRRAHWHTYLVGEGRKIKELKWIDRCGVNIDFESELPVVFHNES